jgi:hypothetical protein
VTSTNSKQFRAKEKIFMPITVHMMIAIKIFSRSALGFRFAALAPELWYVFGVRVSFNNYMLRFVGAPDDVMDCIACFYSQFKPITK